MLPDICTPSELRKNLAKILAKVKVNPVAIKTKDGTRIILDESEYNRLSALANQFEREDPEGDYRPEFVKEMLDTMNNPEFDDSITSLSDID